MGSRISDLTLRSSGKSLDADRDYVVAGWASVNEGTEGPPIWDVVMKHIRAEARRHSGRGGHVRVEGA